MNIFARITKVIDLPDGTCEVHGTAAAEQVDRSREIMDYPTSKPQFETWRDDAIARSGGLSQGNIRAMHGKVAAGKATAVHFDDDNKAVHLETKIVDKEEANKCREGVYTGFSIGGDYLKRWADPTIPGVMRYTPRLAEVSLVDNPCIPGAVFQYVKADGTQQLAKFTAMAGGFSARRGIVDLLAKPTEKYTQDQARDPGARFAVDKDDDGNPHYSNVLRGKAVAARAGGDNLGAASMTAEAATHDAQASGEANHHDKAAEAHTKAAEEHRTGGNHVMALIHEGRAAFHKNEADKARAEKVVKVATDVCKERGGELKEGKCVKCGMAAEPTNLKKQICPECGGELDEEGCCEECGWCLDDLEEVARALQARGLLKGAAAGVQFNVGFPKTGDGGSEVQSVVFDKDKYTVSSATNWLREHDFKGTEADTKENTLRFRQEDPGKYKRFRMITPGASKDAGGITTATGLTFHDQEGVHRPKKVLEGEFGKGGPGSGPHSGGSAAKESKNAASQSKQAAEGTKNANAANTKESHRIADHQHWSASKAHMDAAEAHGAAGNKDKQQYHEQKANEHRESSNYHAERSRNVIANKVVNAELNKGVKYLVTEDDGKTHLPYTDAAGKPDHGLMGGAWAALHGGYRGNKYEGPDKDKAIAHLKSVYESEGMETPAEKATGGWESLVKFKYGRALAKRQKQGLAKSLSDVASFADMLQALHSLEESLEYQHERDGDENSPVCQAFGVAIAQLGRVFIMLATEETNEIISEEAEDIGEANKAQGGSGESLFEMLRKAEGKPTQNDGGLGLALRRATCVPIR